MARRFVRQGEWRHSPPPGRPGSCLAYRYRVRRNSTRPNTAARVLQEMINGTNVSGGWRSTEVHEALDLCCFEDRLMGTRPI